MAQQSSESNIVVKESGTENIKDSLKEIISTNRKEQREALVNKNRVALGEIPKDTLFTSDFVSTKAKILAKRTLNIDEYHQLQNALIQNEENVAAFLQVGSAISALVRDMSSNKPELQMSAANCCCNLALGNAKACATVAKGLSTYLLIVLEGCNMPMMEVALWTIGNMVTRCTKAFRILHAQDALKHLITLLKDWDDIILPAVTYATLRYLYAGNQWIKKEEKEELTKVIMQRKFQYEEINFLWLVALLSSEEDSASYLYNIIPTVIDLLYEAVDNNSHTMAEVTAYIRIIGNLANESTGNIALSFLDSEKHSKEDLYILMDKLFYHRHIHIRKEAIWLIGNLYNHNESKIQAMVFDILSQLSHLDFAISSLT